MRDGQTYRSDVIDIALQVHHETGKSWLVSDTGDVRNAKWVPKSQVENNGDGTFTLPEWLAKEKGFI